MTEPISAPVAPVSAGLSTRTVVWLVCHAIVLGGGLTWAALRHQQLEEAKAFPTPVTNPPIVAPRYNVPEIVSDEQLQRVLHKLRPRLRHHNPQVNHLDHALRFWGVEAKFDDPECYSGLELREVLTDYRLFAKAWEKGTKPLMQKTKYGLRPRLQSGLATASHADHTLACLAETGTPLDYPVLTGPGEAGQRTVNDLYQNSIKAFSLNQVEYEWSTLVFALYSPTSRSWFTTEGQRISFDDLAQRIMRQQPTQGVCAGNHRLHTLTILLRLQEQQPLLSEAMHKQVVEHLNSTTKKLLANQQADGCWDLNWDGTTLSTGENQPVRTRKILATGHALEWWAFAPEAVHPPRDTLVKAGQWLVKTIDEMSDREIASSYTFLSHAGRSLALWRGKFPAQAYQLPK
ncbi:MAG: hypothetical protein V4719_15700 [Planctomycetota bacterium]